MTMTQRLGRTVATGVTTAATAVPLIGITGVASLVAGYLKTEGATINKRDQWVASADLTPDQRAIIAIKENPQTQAKFRGNAPDATFSSGNGDVTGTGWFTLPQADAQTYAPVLNEALQKEYEHQFTNDLPTYKDFVESQFRHAQIFQTDANVLTAKSLLEFSRGLAAKAGTDKSFMNDLQYSFDRFVSLSMPSDFTEGQPPEDTQGDTPQDPGEGDPNAPGPDDPETPKPKGAFDGAGAAFGAAGAAAGAAGTQFFSKMNEALQFALNNRAATTGYDALGNPIPPDGASDSINVIKDRMNSVRPFLPYAGTDTLDEQQTPEADALKMQNLTLGMGVKPANWPLGEVSNKFWVQNLAREGLISEPVYAPMPIEYGVGPSLTYGTTLYGSYGDIPPGITPERAATYRRWC